MEAEVTQQKKTVKNRRATSAGVPEVIGGISEEEQETRNWAVGLHLSAYASYLVPGLGMVAPIAIWLMKKDELPGIDEHGKMMLNFTISTYIYFAVSAVLMLVLIGFPMMLAVSLMAVVYPLIAAAKAKDGEVWNFPGVIKFVK